MKIESHLSFICPKCGKSRYSCDQYKVSCKRCRTEWDRADDWKHGCLKTYTTFENKEEYEKAKSKHW